MPLTRINCCEDYKDTLTINTNLGECVCFEHEIHNEINESVIALDLESVNTLLKVISDWKEVNGYD